MKRNVLLLITSASFGGAERLILDQMRYFDKTRFDLHTVTLRRGNMEVEFSNTNARYYCLDSKHRISYTAIKKLINYIKTHNIDLIHTHLYLPDIYGFIAKMALPRIKLITTKHNTNDFRKRIYWGLLDCILSQPASQIIAVSNSVKEFMSRYEHIPLRRMKVIYHGVDVSRFRVKKNPKELRVALGLKHNDFVVGIVGRVIEQKGHIFLLEAVGKLKKKTRNIHILIIGAGKLEKSLMSRSRELGIENNVRFLGYRKDVVDLYSAMDVLCLPSIFEGLGLVLVEAMFCGTVTIGAKVDGIEEIIEDSVNGFLFPPKNSTALADLLFRIYTTGYDKKLIERGHETALRFDFRKNIRKIENEYIAVLNT